MLTHVRVAGEGILGDLELEGLAPITVVCGPNNSGKSTLLRALSRANALSPGAALSDGQLDRIAGNTATQHGWRGGQDRARENGIYRSLVGEVAATRPRWFQNDAPHFSTALEQVCKSHPLLARWAFGVPAVQKAFAEALAVDVKPVVIPPKRTLETEAGISPGQGVSADGRGLLNVLFKARNQPGDSPEYQLFAEIARAFADISHGFQFGIFLDSGGLLSLHFSKDNGQWIPAPACGLGLQDLLVLLYFALAPGYTFVCVEEPESHLHPDLQRRLLVFLRSVDRQFVLTTHSNVFLNNALVDRVLVTSCQDDRIHVRDATSRASLLDDLGYSVADNLVSDLVILVEGPSDVPVIEELLVKLKVPGRFEVKIWPLGGDIMDQLDLGVLAQGYRLQALLDKDPGSSKVRTRFVRKCEKLGIPVHILTRYAIENYFSVRALRAVFGSQIPAHVTDVDPRKKLDSQIGLNVKSNSRRVARAMTLTELEGTDLLEFVVGVVRSCEEAGGDNSRTAIGSRTPSE